MLALTKLDRFRTSLPVRITIQRLVTITSFASNSSRTGQPDRSVVMYQ
ncbi:hypothetical protein MtrunA17_Chr3g0139611 [Medicago truncatula]|uniref:Uncharacterized protein n=1 Tax=Medicago truncatula TaxID=3880 RepID=A0A396J6C0_MEDTR|nr:hypothetical protein MtrunA17_Chr3g0139611 [Medicago truncatula]